MHRVHWAWIVIQAKRSEWLRIGFEKEVVIAYDCFRLFHQEVRSSRINATRKERRRIK